MFDDLNKDDKTQPKTGESLNLKNEENSGPLKPSMKSGIQKTPQINNGENISPVDDIFESLDKEAPVSNINKKEEIKQVKSEQGSDGVVRILIFVIIFLVVTILGLFVANRVFGFWKFEGLNFFNKSEIVNVIQEKTEEEKEVSEDILEKTEEGFIQGESKEEDANIPDVLEDEEIDEDLDSDSDGLTDAEEKILGTDINNPDTDGDGLFDGDEYLEYKTNAFESDTDEDGLPDSEEVLKYKTDPNNPDTDGDGYSDGEEVKNGYDPTK